ncbi:MAG: GNAT family N-acetyltransferase [Planctomycetota bacterium]|nr:GNAT family N-acetyltransferase [Planctomycetota bacterium]
MPIPPWLRVAALGRIVSQLGGDTRAAAERLAENAASFGIDLRLLFGVLSPNGRQVEEAVLGVIAPGRAAMLFLSEPPRGGDRDATRALAGRVASLHAACQHFSSQTDVRLVQSLHRPEETWASEALQAAGFLPVGTLDYLARTIRSFEPGLPRPPFVAQTLDSGVTLKPLTAFSPAATFRWEHCESTLIAALDASYQDTLDCPELCGLRETRDALAAHRATGHFDPSLWWIAELDGRPEGCMLLSLSPEQGVVELVYVGLSPALRGKRVGSRLLALGLGQAFARSREPGVRVDAMTCAVDQRNTPALRLYERAGFTRVSARCAAVRALRPQALASGN